MSEEKNEQPEQQQEQPEIIDDDSPFDGTIEEELDQMYEAIMKRARVFTRRIMKYGGTLKTEERESQQELLKQYNIMVRTHATMQRVKGIKAVAGGGGEVRSIVDKVQGMRSSVGDIAGRVQHK